LIKVMAMGRARIPASAWRAIVEADPELAFAAGTQRVATPDGSVIELRMPLLAEWTGHSVAKSVAFEYRSGDIVVTRPDREVLAKMLDIARTLGARVQGDDGERYTFITDLRHGAA
jgi:hypothetical protein